MERNSSTSTSIETSTIADDDESTSSTIPIEEEYNLKIRQHLQLDDSFESKNVAKGLMIKGRRALRDYQDELQLDSEIIEQHMSRNPNELLSILKDYNKQQWKESISEKWFHTFLQETESQFHTDYDSVLTQIAEYGFKLMKIDAILSLAIQFFFKFEAGSEENFALFNHIFDSMLSEGYESIKNYEKYLRSNLLNIQIEHGQNALYLALKGYFHTILIDLFNKVHIDTRAFEKILNCVIEAGWWKSIYDERLREIDSINMKDLIEKLKYYCKEQNIPIPIGSSSFDNRDIGQAQEPEPTEEHQVVLMCINHNEKLTLSDLVRAGELTYMNQTFTQVIETLIGDYVSKQRFLPFIQSCFTPIMYLLKRCQNLDDFFKSLYRRYSTCRLTVRKPKLSLRMLIHIILENSELSLSRKIMYLLSQRNPVPFLQPSLSTEQNLYTYVSNITHVWNYSRPTLLSFGIGPCKGKSTVLNRIFLSSFERSMDSIYFQNTIDIDFGYSFLKPRLANIADVHGSIKKTLLERIHQLFNGFLIHIKYEYLKNNRDSCDDILNVLKTSHKYCLLIIRDCPIEDHPHCENELLSEITNCEKYILPDVSDQNDRDAEDFLLNLSDIIWNTMEKKHPQSSSATKNDLEDLMDETYKQETHEIFTAISPLEQALIDTADGKVSVNDYFPEYLIFVELCQLKSELANFNFYGNGTDENVDQVRRKIFQKENELQSAKTHPSRIHKLFCDVLNARNVLVCLDSLIAQLSQARTRYVSQADMASNIPLEKKLSIDVLWRNTIICSQYETEEVQQYLQKQYSEYIKAGFPFEIIDGDNFYFQYSFLYEALQPFRNYRPLVISIIGPQNSGKSTLLNYMFGTLFDVRDGRCTRGLYGSLVKTNRTDFEYIMLIDTEGLLGVEGRDTEYDRRIVLFCLAVSDLVIVNMADELNDPIKQILTLCAESLSKMGVTHIPQPMVHFVLNKRADPNIEKNRVAINAITTEIQKLGLSESIMINENTFHALPMAFQSEGKTLTSNENLSSVTKTVAEFIDRVHSLCGKTLDSVAVCLARTNEYFYSLQWLSSARTIFDTIQKFPDLTYYQDIHERDLDKSLREHIQHDLTNIFSEKYRQHFITECSKQTEQELRDLFETEQQKIDEQTRNNLEERFKCLKVPSTLRRRTEQFLHVQVKQIFKALRAVTIAVNERTKVDALVDKGKGELQKLIEEIIQNERQKSTNERMQIKVVENEFNKMFDHNIQAIRSSFIQEERIKQAYTNIYTNYNIYEKECLFKFQHISEHLKFLSNFNQIESEFISQFATEGYKADSVKVYHYNPNTNYSSNMIKSLVYLNKDLLQKTFERFYGSSREGSSEIIANSEMIFTSKNP
jgi:ribosome biogenesis GTPase A